MDYVFFWNFKILIEMIVGLAEDGVRPIVYSFKNHALIGVKNMWSSPLNEGWFIYEPAGDLIA